MGKQFEIKAENIGPVRQLDVTVELRGGCAYGQHGNATEPTLPHAIPSSAYGCGDHPAWLASEAGASTRDKRHEREDRFCPFDGVLPDGVSAGMFPTPWVAERRERVEIAREVVESMDFADGEYDSAAVQTAIECTVFARNFERWLDSKLDSDERKSA